MPAPAGNRNNLQHGLRSLVRGRLPEGGSYIAAISGRMERELLAAVRAVRGEPTLVDKATVNRACRWERHALMVAKWLREEFEWMTLDTRLRYSRELCDATDRRDRAIVALGIDARYRQSPPWRPGDLQSAGPHASPCPAVDVEATPAMPSVTDSAWADKGGSQC